MTGLLTILLLLSAAMLCTPRGAQARTEIRAAAATSGWRAAARTARHLAVHALLLVVEALRLVRGLVTFIAQVLALLATQLEAAGARGEAA